jgi:hypothetical protein
MRDATATANRLFPSELAARNRQTVRMQAAQINKSLRQLREATQIAEPRPSECPEVSVPPDLVEDHSLERAMSDTEREILAAEDAKSSRPRKRTWLPW